MSNPKPYRGLRGYSANNICNAFSLNEDNKKHLKTIFHYHKESFPSNEKDFFNRIENTIRDCIFITHQSCNQDGLVKDPQFGEVRASLRELEKHTKPFNSRHTYNDRTEKAAKLYELLISLDKVSERFLIKHYQGRYREERKDFCNYFKFHFRQPNPNRVNKVGKLETLEPLGSFFLKINTASKLAREKTPKKNGGIAKDATASTVIELLLCVFESFNLPIKKTSNCLLDEITEFCLIELGVYPKDKVFESSITRALQKI